MRELAACAGGNTYAGQYRSQQPEDWYLARCWLTADNLMRCPEEVSPDDPTGICDKHRRELGLNGVRGIV